MSDETKSGARGLMDNRWVLISGAVLLISLVTFLVSLWMLLRDSSHDAGYLKLVAELRVSSQHTLVSAREAIGGEATAFDALADAQRNFGQSLRTLTDGNNELPSPAAILGDELDVPNRLWRGVDEAAATILVNKESILLLHSIATGLNGGLPDLQQEYTTVVSAMLSARLGAEQVMLAQRQAWLAERIARNVDRMLAGGAVAAEAAEQFNLDAENFVKVLEGMLNGNAALRINRVSNEEARASLAKISDLFQTVSLNVDNIFQVSPDLLQATNAADEMERAMPELQDAVSLLATRINQLGNSRVFNTRTAMIAGTLVLISLLLIGLQLIAGTRRTLARTAETNEGNQQAILRLLDELAGLADGDLTTTATVSEDFTGAIADAINYTIEQLRILVSSINNTSMRVSTAAEDTGATALHLAQATEHQAQEIAGASAAINDMAITIDEVSSNAADSADVANRSVNLAKSGSEVVQNTIKGMDTIREQIQDTAKRIKRLGESSQEIGDIVSLINDIADQTNILALNAAIQASMAGDAGRGFAVVADEVQRLAERSGDATRQIEALVKTIQSDTQEAVLSMEQTTSEVVRGAKLAEDAGVALEEIDNVSGTLAELIQNISNAARQQSSSAGHISNTMNIIQEITSQTSSGTTATAQAISNLAEISNELRNSVAGFKLPGEDR